jgi:hypothetical protein
MAATPMLPNLGLQSGHDQTSIKLPVKPLSTSPVPPVKLPVAPNVLVTQSHLPSSDAAISQSQYSGKS